MPAYLYKCVSCQVEEIRIGGLDDHVALCHDCGDLMLRLDYDLFAPYFESSTDTVTSSLHQLDVYDALAKQGLQEKK
ncbi:hypothetical protein [Desulfobacca acetoxidans]|uniref:Uncharacterized protein n=1 Tax=Desulfobacca acetoxidans (strain ATCC 700848 / DSM 11109 / ASRB2) TaxID=880072 RepID=F2NEP1_DESAR|nr:hypothetical protein [Desulfobacca acetoxidans]AEB08231.1 hypothetical protein Desac_0340 [Desulfobacca acetoxidans DSM 11109]